MVKNKWGIEAKPHRICAIDASTNSLAFAIFDFLAIFFEKLNEQLLERGIDIDRLIV